MPSQLPVAGFARWIYFGLGWLCFGLGVAGAFLPVLPTTPLMIVALWAFSKSSETFQHWLYTHRLFGPTLQRWQQHRVIPPPAKLAAVGAMAASLGYLATFTSAPAAVLALTAGMMLAVAWYILSRPSRLPAAERSAP